LVVDQGGSRQVAAELDFGALGRSCYIGQQSTDGGMTMDEASTKSHIQAHADAVVRGDVDAVVADFSEELRPQVPQLAQALPQPTTSADIQSVEIGDDESVSTIKYSGGNSAVTIRAQWREEGGRPVIVHAEPIG
jgi:hypothetical protein